MEAGSRSRMSVVETEQSRRFHAGHVSRSTRLGESSWLVKEEALPEDDCRYVCASRCMKVNA